MPVGSVFATAVSEIVTTTLAPVASAPLAGVARSHVTLVVTVQFRALLPAFSSVNSLFVTEKGPPTGPLEVKPSFGFRLKASGRSNASCTPLVVVLEGEVAPAPIPRLAKAVQSSR